MKRQPPMKASTSSPVKKSEIPTFDIQRELKPSPDEVRRRAYEIYLGRMHTGEPGSPESDWDRAERELRRR